MLEKKENETTYEYGLRIIQSKCNNEIDLDWDEIVELLGLDCHRDSLRKAANVTPYSGVAVAKYYQDKIENMIVENSDNVKALLEEIKLEKKELYKERVKLSTVRSEINKQLRKDGRKELFYEEVLNAVRSKSFDAPIYDLVKENLNSNKEYIQLISDVHYGSTFDIGINKFSPQICEERFFDMYSQMKELIKEENICHIHVASQGDLVQGLLRITDLKLNSKSMIEQIIDISRIVANYLNNLSKHTDVTYYHTINANHSEFRALGTKSGELEEDVELLIGNFIKELLTNNKRVNVIVASESVMDVNLCGYNIGILHGQNIKNKETFLRDLSATRHINYDYLLIGHIHHTTCTTVGTGYTGNATQIISSPSIVGSCSYSKKIMKTAPAGFLVLCFEENKGKTKMFELTLK